MRDSTGMYPKTFFAGYGQKVTPGTCFVIMPFAKEFTPTFKAIQKAVEKDSRLHLHQNG